MANTFMCQYGNCQEQSNLKITVTDRDGGERARFCCHEHAGLWLLRRAWQYGARDAAQVKRLQGAIASDLRN